MAGPTAESIAGSLKRYRVMAYIVGVVLIIFVAAIIAKNVFHVIDSDTYLAIAHGWLFMIYLLCALDLSLRMRWSLPRILFVGVAGTIPFLSFVAENRVMSWVHAELGSIDTNSGTRPM